MNMRNMFENKLYRVIDVSKLTEYEKNIFIDIIIFVCKDYNLNDTAIVSLIYILKNITDYNNSYVYKKFNEFDLSFYIRIRKIFWFEKLVLKLFGGRCE